MTHFSIPYSRITEIPAPAAYEVRSGNWWLHGSLENGEALSWGERHVITINEATGHFTCEGGYGTFSYCWPSPNRGAESLHAFLYDLHFDYFMGKASKQPHRIVDFDATIVDMKRTVLEYRRQHGRSSQWARTVWKDIAEIAEALSTNEGLMDYLWHQASGETYNMFADDGGPGVMVDHPGMRRFWDDVWTPFAAEVLKPHWLAHRAAVDAAKVAA